MKLNIKGKKINEIKCLRMELKKEKI